MELTDYSKEYEEIPSVGKHSALFPKNIFCDNVEAMGCGKTMLLTNILRKPDILYFVAFYIYYPTLHQKAYKNLKKNKRSIIVCARPSCHMPLVTRHIHGTARFHPESGRTVALVQLARSSL